MVEQQVIIKLVDEFLEEMGTLTISAIDFLSNEVPTFRLYDGLTLKNVPVLDSPNSLSPIIYYNNFSSNIPKLMLLEETEYQILFESEHADDNFEILYSLTEINNSHFKEIRFPLKDSTMYKTVGSLNFKSYVGKSFLDVRKNGVNSIKIPIEVRSKKIDYLNQYSAMISDLSQHVLSLIFELDSPLYQEFEINFKEKETYYEDFMFLEFLFRQDNMPSIFEYLSKNLHSRLKNNVETVPLYLASNIDHNTLKKIVSNPNNLIKSEGTQIIVNKLGGYIPREIDQIKHEDILDIPENRFFKYFLELIRDLIDNLLVNSAEGYIKDKLLDFKDETGYYLSNRFFNHISKLDYVPFNSQVLQKKEGYREIFQYFLMLEFSFKLSWDEINDKFKGFEKKLSELYEYWCYFKLLKVLNDLSEDDINFDDIFSKNKDGWSIKINRGQSSGKKFKILIDGIDLDIELFYNLSFSKNSPRYVSYSLIFKPDYTLKICRGDSIFYIHFDAKYRSELEISNYYEKINGSEDIDERDDQEELESVYKNGDIYKMHTYKDSILKSQGAYVLYPGGLSDKFHVFDNKEIPSVGAFSLTPGCDDGDEEDLSNFIMAVLKIISDRNFVDFYEWNSLTI